MTTRKKILLAVANGCKSTRQIAKYLGVSYGAINNYFYTSNKLFGGLRFINGRLLQWSPGKANTIRRGPLAAIIRGPDGQVKDAGMGADMDDLEASYLTRGRK